MNMNKSTVVKQKIKNLIEITHYVRDLNAAEHGSENPIAANAIKNHHYVNDFIDSTATVEEAIVLARGVRDIQAKGGFFMRNWTSNSPEVLAALEHEGELTEKIFANNTDPVHVEKILGMYWDSHTDHFKYVLKFARLQQSPESSQSRNFLFQIFACGAFSQNLELKIGHIFSSFDNISNSVWI